MITRVVQDNWKQLKVVSLLKLCNEKETLERLFKKGVIAKQIEHLILEDPALREDKDKWIQVGTAFIAGFEMGYANAHDAYIKDEDEKVRICKLAAEQSKTF